MQIKVRDHDTGDLANDLADITRKARSDMVRTVREAGKVGNTVARDNARRTAGKHGKLYPRAFSWEMRSSLFGGAGVIAVEYGPDRGKRQGNMEFEFGSRNSPPHLDLARSADLMGPVLAGEVSRLPDKWFW